jgi:phosphatidylinositol dimannoside acyltransferase
VSFFGRPATMPGGAALLAAQTGAALIPTVCSFTERGWRLTFAPEVPVDDGGRLKDRVGTAMQAVADAFATTIAERPEDWHMLGRIWSDVPPDPPEGGPRAGAPFLAEEPA